MRSTVWGTEGDVGSIAAESGDHECHWKQSLEPDESWTPLGHDATKQASDNGDYKNKIWSCWAGEALWDQASDGQLRTDSGDLKGSLVQYSSDMFIAGVDDKAPSCQIECIALEESENIPVSDNWILVQSSLTCSSGSRQAV